MHNQSYSPLTSLYEQSFNNINYSAAKAEMQKIIPEQSTVTRPEKTKTLNQVALRAEKSRQPVVLDLSGSRWDGTECAGPRLGFFGSEQQSSFSDRTDTSYMLQLLLFPQIFAASRGEEGSPEKHWALWKLLEMSGQQHLMRQHRGTRPESKV